MMGRPAWLAVALAVAAWAQPSSIERLIDTGQLAEARIRLKELPAPEYNSARGQLLEAMICYREQRPADALSRLENVLAVEPSNANAHKLAALCLVALRRSDEAAPHIREAVRLAPRDFMARYYLGLHQIDKQQPEQAVATFSGALQLNPEYPDLYTMLGYAHELTGDEVSAISSYRKAIDLAERHRVRREFPYVYLGRFLNGQNRNDEALPVLEKAVATNPVSLEAWLLLGKVRSALGQNSEALEALKQALSIAPKDKRAHYLMMQTYQRMGRLDEARRERILFEQMAGNELTRWEESVQGSRQALPPD